MVSDSKSLSKTYKKYAEPLFESVKEFKGIGKMIDPIASAIQEHMIAKQLICFDDIERRGGSLKLRLLLGYISHLKEEKNCKIVMILNEDMLSSDEEGKRDLDTYREKIVDRDDLLP